MHSSISCGWSKYTSALGALVLCFAALTIPADADNSTPLRYHFRLERLLARRLVVQLQVTGRDRDTTTFEVNREWGGVSAGGEDLADVRITNLEGIVLDVEHPEPHRWRVRHAPNETLLVEYSFAANRHQADPQAAVNRRPIMNEQLFHAYGTLALLTPVHLEKEMVRPIEIGWEGFETAGWKVACSFGVGEHPAPFDASISQLQSAVFIAGECDLVERTIGKSTVWVALARGDWSFTAPALADLVEKVITLERDFFRDPGQPFYLVTAIPVGTPQEGSHSFGGTALTHSFSLAMLENTPLEGGPGLGLAGLLVHELFHEWNGHTLRGAEPEALVYWWTEGMTDFYTRRFLYRGGFIDRAGYVESLNEKLRGFLASPVRNAPNERIRADFWRQDAIQQLPYARGDLVAMQADGAIRRASNGERSLDDLMRDLVAESRGTQMSFDTEALLRRIESLAGDAETAKLRSVVVEGKTPEIDPRTFEPCLQLATVDLGPWDLGFDFDATRAAGHVVGLRNDSRAYAAGMRDGQRLRGWSVHFGDPMREVELVIEKAGEPHTIRYLPQGPPTPTPQFTVRDGATEKDCRCL